MSAADTAQQAIEAFNASSRDLAALHRERGDVASAMGNARIQGYQDAIANGATVSDARHAADLASKHLQSETAKMDGEIQGLLVELRYLEQLLTHVRWIAGMDGVR